MRAGSTHTHTHTHTHLPACIYASGLAPPVPPPCTATIVLHVLHVLHVPQEGIATYEAALKLDATSKDLWLNLGMACKELCWVERAEQVRPSGRVCQAALALRLLAAAAMHAQPAGAHSRLAGWLGPAGLLAAGQPASRERAAAGSPPPSMSLLRIALRCAV